jgi:hypothetical protein
MDALVDTSKSISWCVSRRCLGSVAEIAEYLTGRFRSDATVITEPGRLTVVPGIIGAVVTVGPVRVHRARLRFGILRPPARVTIEVEPWSGTESELLLRPTRRPPRGEDAYFAAALAVLEALAAEIDASLTLVSEITANDRLRRAS